MRSAAKQGRRSRQSPLIGHRRRVDVTGAYDSHSVIMAPVHAAFVRPVALEIAALNRSYHFLRVAWEIDNQPGVDSPA